jgi:hypothetical protein
MGHDTGFVFVSEAGESFEGVRDVFARYNVVASWAG